VDFLPADFVELFGGLLVNDFVAGWFGFVFLELFGDLQGAVGQVGMLLPAVVLDAIGVYFVQFFVLFYEGKLAAFASVDVLKGFVDRLAADLGFHKVFDVRGFVFVGEFCCDEVDLFG
jgi:hypothetical protein